MINHIKYIINCNIDELLYLKNSYNSIKTNDKKFENDLNEENNPKKLKLINKNYKEYDGNSSSEGEGDNSSNIKFRLDDVLDDINFSDEAEEEEDEGDESCDLILDLDDEYDDRDMNKENKDFIKVKVSLFY
jgi:hypothetical protein